MAEDLKEKLEKLKLEIKGKAEKLTKWQKFKQKMRKPLIIGTTPGNDTRLYEAKAEGRNQTVFE